MASRRSPVVLILIGGFTLTLVLPFVVFAVAAPFAGGWPPSVIMESSSMMRRDSDASFGRLGTLDPGDVTLLRRVAGPEDVETRVEGGRKHHGAPGDVIAYHPNGDGDRPAILHRAVAYVEARPADGGAEYWVRWAEGAPCEGEARTDGGSWCVFGPEGVHLPAFSIHRPGSTEARPIPYKPEHSGFITKGDNPSTNQFVDQVSGLSPAVKAEWIVGKTRGEIPGVGLVKLALADRANEQNPPGDWTRVGGAFAPGDLWAMMVLSFVAFWAGCFGLAAAVVLLLDRRRPRYVEFTQV